MKKLSNFFQINSLFNLPSNVITVGKDNCNFSSLSEALLNSKENDSFLIFPGDYEGPFSLKHNQSFTFIGHSSLNMSSNDYLFTFNSPPEVEPESRFNFRCYFNGDMPFINPYSSYKLFKNPLNNDKIFFGTVNLVGLTFFRSFQITQSGTNNPILLNAYSDIIPFTNYSKWPASNPVRDSAGIYFINAGLDSQGFRLINHSYSINNFGDPFRKVVWQGNSDMFVFDINVYDIAGNLTDNFSINVDLIVRPYLAFL